MICSFFLLASLLLNPSYEDQIQERSSEITEKIEKWKPFIEKERKENFEFFAAFDAILETGYLLLASQGLSGTYFLYNKENVPSFIVKPFDEDIFCLNNPKRRESVLPDKRAKEHIPAYTSIQRALASYHVAKLLNIENATPPVFLAILSNASFYNYNNITNGQEKLCSLQPYLPQTIPLVTLLQKLFYLGLSDSEMEKYFDQEDFEDLSLFLWITYDNDAGPENFLAYVKKVDEKNNQVYGIKKIDNNQTFPEKNKGLLSFFWEFPHAKKRLSQKTIQRINTLSFEDLKTCLKEFCLEQSISSLDERVLLLQKLVKNPKMTYYKVSKKLQRL